MEAEDQEEAVENPTLVLEITVWKVVANKIIQEEVAVEVVDMEIMEEVEVRKLAVFLINIIRSIALIMICQLALFEF